MTDEVQTHDQAPAGVDPALTTPEHAATVDHPHAGIAAEGWSAPGSLEGPISQTAKLVLKRGGVATDHEFPVSTSAIIGRFDPSVGPIDVDLGSLNPEGSYVSRKHAKIWVEHDTWRIRDLGSSNGTFLLRDDFERVEEAELSDGVEIAFGNARFVFHLVPVS